MRTLTISILALVTSFFSTYSQSQWQQVYGPQTYFLKQVASVNSNVVVATGEHGLILRSTNAGVNWQQVPSGTNMELECLSFNGNTGIACGGYMAFLKTTNGGMNWTNLNLQGFYGFDIINVQVLNDNTFLMVTKYYFNMTYFYDLRKTTNNGANWSTLFTITSTSQYGAMNDVQFINEQIGFITSNGKVRKTTNGGVNWTIVANVNDSVYKSEIYFVDENTGYFISNINYNSLNRIYKTTNGGFNWVQQYLPSSTAFANKVHFVNTSTGMILSDNGNTYRTTNGGSTWTLEQTYSLNVFYDICMTGNSEAVTVGSYTVILKYNGLTGISHQNNQIPEGFNLSQNYPNPFNPATKISFSLPKASFVMLVVYDVTGKEVETLVNENLGAGSFEVDFNASKLTSGAYFYRITADGFTDVRKMILVK